MLPTLRFEAVKGSMTLLMSVINCVTFFPTLFLLKMKLWGHLEYSSPALAVASLARLADRPFLLKDQSSF